MRNLFGSGIKLHQKCLLFVRILLDFVAVCAQRGNVADDGIVDFQQLEAVGQAAAVFSGSPDISDKVLDRAAALSWLTRRATRYCTLSLMPSCSSCSTAVR